MHKILMVCLGFVITLTMGCYTPPPQTPSTVLTTSALIKHISNSTVAIMVKNESDWKPVCTGVWINDTSFLTAGHCVEPDDYVDTVSITGTKVHYSVQSEVVGLGKDPKSVHLGILVLHDHARDLALVRVVGNKYPLHDNAAFGSRPAIGDNVHMVGHLHGLYYSYTRGVMSSFREDVPQMEVIGPFLQVSMPLWHGNSGGGGFNDAGELIGIADFIAPAPHVGFLIDISSVRLFLLEKE